MHFLRAWGTLPHIVHPHAYRCFRALALAAGMSLAAGETAIVCAQPAAKPVYNVARWHVLRVPGTPDAVMRAARLPPTDWEPVRFTREFIRVWHSEPRGDEADRLDRKLTQLWYLMVGTGSGLPLSRAALLKDRSRFESLLQALDIRTNGRGETLTVRLSTDDEAVDARPVLDAAGYRTDAIVKALNAGQSVTLTSSSFIVPWPLAPIDWKRLVLENSELPDEAIFAETLKSPRASLLYYGLLSLDSETLDYVMNSRLLERIRDDAATAFAVYGGALRIRGGHVVVPGGQLAIPYWERLAGKRVTQTDDFIMAVLSRDEGRLAAVYDTVASFDAPHQAFVFGWWMQDSRLRERRARDFFDAALELSERNWNLDLFRFAARRNEVGTMLRQVQVYPNGRPRGAESRPMWEWVFESSELPEREENMTPARSEADLIDAAWIVRTFGATDSLHRRDSFYFAQRLWPAVTSAILPHAAFALRGYGSFPALLHVMERMDVRSPHVYSTVLKRADSLTKIADERNDFTGIVQFQSTIVLLDRLRAARALTEGAVERLLVDLADLRPNDRGHIATLLVIWINRALLPALEAATGKDPDGFQAPRERALLRAMAGVKATPPTASFLFEDFTYRLDLAAPRLRNLVDVRQRQAGNSLDAVMHLIEAAIAFETNTLASFDAGRRSFTLASRDLQQPPREATAAGDPPSVAEVLRRAATRIERTRERGGRDRLSGTEAIADDLRRLCEYLLTHVLRSLAYAPHVGDANSPLLLDGDIAHRHDIGVLSAQGPRRQLMWTQAQAESRGVPWHLRGSLVGMDMAFGSQRLPLTSSGAPPVVQYIEEPERRALLRTLVLVNPFAMSDEDGKRIAATIRRGRDSEEPLEPSGPTSQWMINARLWARQHTPERPGPVTSVAEYYWRGRPGAGGPAGWGAPADIAGCWCLQIIVDQPWEHVPSNQIPSPLVAYTPDIMLRLTELLDEMRLPAALVGDLLPEVVRGALDEADLGHNSDWTAVLRYAANIDRNLIADRVSRLTVDGPLIPTSTSN